MITQKNIYYHELIGLEVEITNSTNPSLIKRKGKVIFETRNMLFISDSAKPSKEIKIPKAICCFRFKLPSEKEVEVKGDLLVGRPEKRLKCKRVRK